MHVLQRTANWSRKIAEALCREREMETQAGTRQHKWRRLVRSKRLSKRERRRGSRGVVAVGDRAVGELQMGMG